MSGKLSNEAVESKAIESLKKRLTEQTDEVVRLEALLSGAKRRRGALILKLARAKLSERTIGKLAGLSGPRIHQVIADACNCSPGLSHVGEIGEYATAGCPVHGRSTDLPRSSGDGSDG